MEYGSMNGIPYFYWQTFTMETLYYIGLVQAFFTAFLVGTKQEKSMSDHILFVWLLTIGSNMAFLLFIPNTPLPFYQRVWCMFNLLLLYGPMLYYYTKAVTTGRFQLYLGLWALLVPFVIVNLSGLFISDEGFASMETNLMFFSPGSNWTIRIIWALTILFSLFFYSVKNILLIRNYSRSFKDNFSNDSSLITLHWLRVVNYIFLAGFLPLIVVGLFSTSTGIVSPFPPILFITVSLTVLTFAVSYLGFRQPKMFYPSLLVKASQEEQTEVKLNLPDSELTGYTEKLNYYLGEEKLYLNSELTLQMLADHIQIPKYQLTQLLNRHLEKNFYQLINEYRVREAQVRLKDEKYKHLTVIAVGFDSGFKSKSTFNTIFKQETGKTPSEYRKS